jgi:hypothetical protein
VNLAFAPFGDLGHSFPGYASYWLFLAATFSVSLFAVERVLQPVLRRMGAGSVRAASQAG